MKIINIKQKFIDLDIAFDNGMRWGDYVEEYENLIELLKKAKKNIKCKYYKRRR